MCPSMWSTPTTGMPRAKANALAKHTPDSSAPTSPGPSVTATPSMSAAVTPASASACVTTGVRFVRCCREAISGTTPP